MIQIQIIAMLVNARVYVFDDVHLIVVTYISRAGLKAKITY